MRRWWLESLLWAAAALAASNGYAVLSAVSEAKLNLKAGTLNLKYYDDVVTIGQGYVSTERNEGVSINLLSPITAMGSLFSKSNTRKLSPLDYTFVRIFGDPDDFGLFTFQSICNGPKMLFSRWFYQSLNVNTGHMDMSAKFVSGSLVIGAMIQNELPWIHSTLEKGPDDICDETSNAGKSLEPYRLKQHIEKDPTGLYLYKYDGKRGMKISWDAAHWYDRVEVDAMRLSKEIRDLLKSARGALREP